MAKWPNYLISGKQFQKRPNSADLAFLKATWQPWYRKCTARGINFSFWYFFCYPSLSERDNDREGRCSLDGAGYKVLMNAKKSKKFLSLEMRAN